LRGLLERGSIINKSIVEAPSSVVIQKVITCKGDSRIIKTYGSLKYHYICLDKLGNHGLF